MERRKLKVDEGKRELQGVSEVKEGDTGDIQEGRGAIRQQTEAESHSTPLSSSAPPLLILSRRRLLQAPRCISEVIF